MTSPGARTHYEVLGIPPDASPGEVRRAHRQLAQVLHPDRHAGATPQEQALAERRMREVNAAWTALSDPLRRAEYDRSLRAARTGPTSAPSARPGPTMGPAATRFVPDAADAGDLDDGPDLPAHQFWLLRRGPVIGALLVAAVVFVVSAYAGGGSTDRRRAVPPGCVRVVQDRTAIRILCTEPNDGTIVTVVPAALDCPSGTRGVLIDAETKFSCVRSVTSRDGLPVRPVAPGGGSTPGDPTEGGG